MTTLPNTASQQKPLFTSQSANPKKRHNSAATSLDAWHVRKKRSIAGQQTQIVSLLREAKGLTRKEIALRLNTIPSSVTAAVNGLREAGLVRQTQERRDGGFVLVLEVQKAGQ